LADDDQGLGVFVQFGWAPSDRNSVTRYLGAGLAYQGLLPGRSRDTLVFAVSRTEFVGSGPAGRRATLVNLEAFYKVELTPWVHLQPDVQYFNNPDIHRKNGMAAGIRWLVRF
jgi:porin